ncbi:glycosyltransferase [Thermoleophilia bacterium SCSIO 60948]|nr:glycosyltransferase [Thermoleophilia bacterium SCSIO 60948]
MRVLVVTNITPDLAAPARGSYVRDQVEALRDEGLDVELLSFPLGKSAYPPAIREIRRRIKNGGFDLVHAHYGLAGACAALAGARPLVVTYHGTDVRHPAVGAISRMLSRRADLVSAASLALFSPEGGRPGLTRLPGRSAILPCGADLSRFSPRTRRESRRRLGLEPDGRYLFFPAATFRPEKRFDRARELARLTDAQLLSGGSIPSERMPDWINAADAVVITSENEGFGLVAVEALACDVPVLSTPVGIAPTLLAGIDGCLTEPFHAERWAEVARRHLDHPDPRVDGRPRAEWLSARRMARRAVRAYRDVLADGVERERSLVEAP